MDNLFEYVFDPSKMEGVFCASLVESPAIEVEMVHCSKEEEPQLFQLASEEKRLIVSPLMIPNKKVWRNNLDGYVFASEQTVRQLQQNFSKQRYGNGSKLEHFEPIDGVFIAETWLIEDPSNDKANALGFTDLPKGTWMIAMYIEDDAVWADYIKTGKVKGVSIEAVLGVKKVTNNVNSPIMNRKTLTDIVEMAIQKVALAADLKQFDIEGAEPVFASELVLDAMVMDKDNKPMADAEFIFDGKMFKTDAAGILIDIAELPKEEPEITVIEMAEDPMVAQQAMIAEWEAKLAEKDALVTSLESDLATTQAKLADAEAKIVKLEADVVLKETEMVEMSKQTPASEGIKNVPIEVAEKEVTSGLLATVRKFK